MIHSILIHLLMTAPLIGCGVTAGQKDVANTLTALMTNLSDQAKTVFGDASNLFQGLVSGAMGIFKAGPSQEGMSPAQKATLDSAAITNTGLAYKHASQAAGERGAAAGGGNIFAPSGVQKSQDAALAQAGAQATASQLTDIHEKDFELGHENYNEAAKVLLGAPNVFNPASEMANTAVKAGGAADQAQTDVSNAENSWMQPVAGVLGSVAGDFTFNVGGGKKG